MPIFFSISRRRWLWETFKPICAFRSCSLVSEHFIRAITYERRLFIHNEDVSFDHSYDVWKVETTISCLIPTTESSLQSNATKDGLRSFSECVSAQDILKDLTIGHEGVWCFPQLWSFACANCNSQSHILAFASLDWKQRNRFGE